MSWTIKTVNECWKCKHLQKSIYMESERETVYNCWCEVGDMDSKEKCEKFESVKRQFLLYKERSMEIVKCSHCGEDILKEQAIPCVWEQYNMTWYYCKRCNDGCYRDEFEYGNEI